MSRTTRQKITDHNGFHFNGQGICPIVQGTPVIFNWPTRLIGKRSDEEWYECFYPVPVGGIFVGKVPQQERLFLLEFEPKAGA
jgi:hypothetical protein